MTESIKQLLVILTPILFIANLVQSFFYLPEAAKREGGGHMPGTLYYVLLFLFFGAMMFSLFATSLPLMWVAIELTTLLSAPLIAYHRDKGSLEAMWKYLLICSIGIAFALFGTMLVLHAQTTGSARWYMAGFAFVLAGYGTKMGLSLFHTWLPDAHSEAPAPVSALLSGALLNCSFFGIVRFREIMPQAASPFCDNAMLGDVCLF
jgi:hydrogenase-4 component F